jgi:hypothetical protein
VGQDFVGGLHPDEGMSPCIPTVDEALDGVLEVWHAAEDTAGDSSIAVFEVLSMPGM